MHKEPKPIRVMLADDHPIVMTGFAMSLAGQGMDVVGQAKTPDEAVTMYADHRPDVAVLDIRFGTGMTGLDAAETILKADPKAKVVFLSQFDQDSLIKETYRLGAHAFVTKDCDPADLGDAVRHAEPGQAVLPAADRRAPGQPGRARRRLAAVATGRAQPGDLPPDGRRA